MGAEDYLTPYDTPDTPGEAVVAKKNKDMILTPDHELIRKRDVLANAAMLIGLKDYVGENITAIQIRKMEKKN